MRIAMGSDHRGYAHIEKLLAALTEAGHEVEVLGVRDAESADYPDPALAVAEKVSRSEADCGILVCGSGIGVSIAANKVKGVRASLCFTPDQARMTRRHNDSNVLCLSGDALEPGPVLEVAEAWLASEFEGGRHARRVAKITAYEDEHHR